MPRVMTEDEQTALLTRIARELSYTGMVNMDDILHGSLDSCEKSGKQFNAVTRIMEAIPKDVREEFNAALRKKKADDLRARADKLEKGETE